MRCRALALLLLAFGIPGARAAEPGDDVVSNIARLPVDSSALLSVGYSKEQHILEVEFRKEGVIYRYLDVPENVFRELLEAPSKAGYYNENIRGHYRSTHVVKPAGQ
jgi:KTSC domain